MTTAHASIPFGLLVAAREPVPVDEVDLTALVYDPERQLMLVRDGQTGMVMPWCKHSTGKTNTDSNTDGHGGRETDEDYTED
jgi:putative ATP-grasp target RiPP